VDAVTRATDRVLEPDDLPKLPEPGMSDPARGRDDIAVTVAA
jgi:hypothetical protein